MIVLDTNVVSEPLRQRPHPGVVAWLDAQLLETLYLTSITIAEVRFGIAALADGQRKTTLNERFETDIVPLFTGRTLSFDEPASSAYPRLRNHARAIGLPIGDSDALIAAIARANDLTVATRDTQPFDVAGVPVINPFDEHG